MRGQVIKFEEGIASISGADGRRYQLTPSSDGKQERMLLIGAEIDFVPDGDTATEPVLVKKSSQEKSRYVAAFLALVLGIFGIDRFYLGWVSSGIAIAVVFIVTLVGNATLNSTPLTDIMTGDSNYLWKGNVQNFIWISAIFWALCRCVAYLSKSDQQFFDSYLSYEAMRVDS